MNLFQWIFGKHVPRPPDPERSAALRVLPRWQADAAIEALTEAGITATLADNFTSYLLSTSIESTATIFVMEPDLVAGSAVVDELFGTDGSVGERPLLRPIDPADAADIRLLRAMLYEALFVPPGHAEFLPTIVDRPELSRYIEGFGTAFGDLGWCAESVGGEAIGAAWVRLLQGANAGYGFVDDATPELTLAVAPGHRNEGVGGDLLVALLDDVGRCSLSCDSRNPAVRLYERFGFVVVRADGDSVVMLRS